MSSMTVPQVPLRPVDSLGNPRRPRFADKSDQEIRQEALGLRKKAADDEAKLGDLQADEQRLAQAIHDHELSVLQRQLAAAKHNREQLEASIESAKRRADGMLRAHQHPKIVECREIAVATLNKFLGGELNLVEGRNNVPGDVAIARCRQVLDDLDRLALEGIADPLPRLHRIMATIGQGTDKPRSRVRDDE